MVDRVNASLLAQRPPAHHRAAYERWLDPHAATQYRKVYEQVFVESR